jgi:peptidoglycan/xylan/chitin deacetylase (PgdA/CDA1 family)
MERTMRIYRLPPAFFRLFPKILWKDFSTSDRLYLTFDDGPDPIFTAKILAILEKERTMASFFVVGQKAQQYPEIIQQMNQSGHTIGIHSFEHRHLFYQPKAYIQEQLSKNKLIVEQIIGKPVRYFRPPYGLFSPRLIQVCRELNLKLVLWSVMSYDFDENISDKFILKLIKTKVSSGDIIVFHDGHVKSERTVRILGSVIKTIKEKRLKLNSIH